MTRGEGIARRKRQWRGGATPAEADDANATNQQAAAPAGSSGPRAGCCWAQCERARRLACSPACAAASPPTKPKPPLSIHPSTPLHTPSPPTTQQQLAAATSSRSRWRSRGSPWPPPSRSPRPPPAAAGWPPSPPPPAGLCPPHARPRRCTPSPPPPLARSTRRPPARRRLPQVRLPPSCSRLFGFRIGAGAAGCSRSRLVGCSLARSAAFDLGAVVGGHSGLLKASGA